MPRLAGPPNDTEIAISSAQQHEGGFAKADPSPRVVDAGPQLNPALNRLKDQSLPTRSGADCCG